MLDCFLISFFFIFLSILFSGSAGSSIKSSSSPNGEDSRPTSSRPASGQSFIRHSIDRSFGQSILKRATNQSVKSVRTQDLVDRDEDAETTYSRQSIRLLESPRLILSRDHAFNISDFPTHHGAPAFRILNNQ